MNQIAFFPTAPPQPAAVAGTNQTPQATTSFTSQLDQAISQNEQAPAQASGQNEPTPATQDNTTQVNNSEISGTPESTPDASTPDDSGLAGTAATANLINSTTPQITLEINIQGRLVIEQSISISSNGVASISLDEGQAKSGSLSDRLFSFSDMGLHLGHDKTTHGTASAQPFAHVRNGKIYSSNANSELLAQLQRIIDSGQEKGVISITSSGAGFRIHPYRSDLTLNPQPQPQLVGMVGEESSTELVYQAKLIKPDIALDRPADRLTSLRQDTQQQFYEAKMKAASGTTGDNQPGSEKNDSGAGNTPQSATTLSQASQTPTGLESKGDFASVLSSPQVQVDAGSTVSRPITLPSGIVVHEQEVIQQLIERFQLMRRPNDSRINLKLHPAELGELKIDMTVREGAIRAHVVAQSQHVQQILERNISKLRTVLENQGLNIDEITFEATSDFIGDFDLFEQQLFSRNHYTPPGQEKKSSGTFNLDRELDSRQSSVQVTV